MIRRCFAHGLALLGALPAALWIARHEKIILRRGRPLRPPELRFATAIGIANPQTIRIFAVPEIPSPLAGCLEPLENLVGFSLRHAAGVTLGSGIYVAASQECEALVFHELVHVLQYQRLGGPLPFIYQYFAQCLAVGYHHAPLEREAVTRSNP